MVDNNASVGLLLHLLGDSDAIGDLCRSQCNAFRIYALIGVPLPRTAALAVVRPRGRTGGANFVRGAPTTATTGCGGTCIAVGPLTAVSRR